MKDDRDPALFAFGTAPIPRLTREEEAVAGFEDRLKAIWPYLCRRAARANARLPRRDRISFGVDDFLSEMVIALKHKDYHWSAARGRYVTFAEQVCRSCLADLRVKAHVVRCPSNAFGKLAKLRGLEAQGKLGERQERLLRALERALGETEALPVQPDEDTGHLSEPATAEHAACRAEAAPAHEAAARALVATAGPLHALVLTRTFGLFGVSPVVGQVLAGSSPGRGRRLARVALERLRQRTHNTPETRAS